MVRKLTVIITLAVIFSLPAIAQRDFSPVIGRDLPNETLVTDINGQYRNTHLVLSVANQESAYQSIGEKNGRTAEKNIATKDSESKHTTRLQDVSQPKTGKNLGECVTKLEPFKQGWCRVGTPDNKSGMSSVWPKNLDRKTHQIGGPGTILIAWSSTAFDSKRKRLYFFGGGHADYGGNEVYEFDLIAGKWARLTDPSPLDYLAYGKNDRGDNWYFWIPDVRKVPGATHTYDGLLFNSKTETIFLIDLGSAMGAQIEIKDPSDPRILYGKDANGERGMAQYEFNPSQHKIRNGLKPLTWRRVGDYKWAYPRSAELPDGSMMMGTRNQLYWVTQKKDGKLVLGRQRIPYTADWGDGTLKYDPKRKALWSLHRKKLLRLDRNGREVQQINADVPHGKSIAFDKRGNIVSWNGGRIISTLNPDNPNPKWRKIDWGNKGPPPNNIGRVYEKWRYLVEENVFVGIANHVAGVWVYKHKSK